ncbi:MAG: hypothetical protein COA79_06790 [Planctomycetota bacterium]|nr:MAG: hypothetical protein COA79_06790 [Planctomycetota bacterium]
MEELIKEYYNTMKLQDPNFHWSDPNWWKHKSKAKIILAKDNQGFAIIGYEDYVDKDVESEICELYCKMPAVFLSLIRSCIPHIKMPFGFQILQSNIKAIRCFEGITKKLGFEYQRHETFDGLCRVIKYRITSAKNS